MSLEKFSYMTILIADDHPMYRRGLRSAIKSFGFDGVILEAKNGNEVISYHRQCLIDLYILDHKMPELTGYEAVKIILRSNPKARIILNTMYDEPSLITAYLEEGITGYIDKNSEPEQFEQAIRYALSGWGVYNSLQERNAYSSLAYAPIQFTKREKQLIELLAQGSTTHDIAQKLDLTFKTVETYRCRLLDKVSVKNTSELLHYVHKNGLI